MTATEPKKFSMVSLAAKATARPPMPRPVRRGRISMEKAEAR